MSSIRLTQSLSQRMVLTPQLRQRIEMLQMTSVELSELIQNEMVTNPILEEVSPHEEEWGNFGKYSRSAFERSTRSEF